MDSSPSCRRSIDSYSSEDPEFFERLAKSKSESEYDDSSPDEDDSIDAMSPPKMRAEQERGKDWTNASASAPGSLLATRPTVQSNSSGRAPDGYASSSDDSSNEQRMGQSLPLFRHLSDERRNIGQASAAARKAKAVAGSVPTSTGSNDRGTGSRSQARSQQSGLWPKGVGASSGSESDSRNGSGSEGESVAELGGGSYRYLPQLPPIKATGMSPAMDEMAAEKGPQRSPTADLSLKRKNWGIRDLLAESIQNDDFEAVANLINCGFADPHAARPSDLRTPLMISIERCALLQRGHASDRKGDKWDAPQRATDSAGDADPWKMPKKDANPPIKHAHQQPPKLQDIDGSATSVQTRLSKAPTEHARPKGKRFQVEQPKPGKKGGREKPALKIAKLLIKYSLPEQLVAQDIDGNTALMLAVSLGVDPIVRCLLRSMNPEQMKIRNHVGMNALQLALDGNRIPATRYLLAAGADVPDANGYTALFAAILAENTKRMEVLIKAGAMINQTGPKHATPLSIAIRKGDIRLVKSLLDLGAHADQSDPRADLPLMIAARHGRIEIITELLEHGASVQRVNPARIGALHIAAKCGHIKVMALLINHGADVKAQDNYGVTPLHAASYFGHVEAVQLLINKGAPLECVDQHGCTPLHYAARFGGGDCCKLLISRGADIHATDRNGTGVLVKARMSDDPESFAALLCAYRQDDGVRGGGRGCALV